jgi:SAM-dependent methyltransferase
MLEDRDRWNRKYAAADACGEMAPAAVLEAELHRLPMGRALDLACGPGRNALYLAGKGYEVIGIDISDVALAKAGAEAHARGLDIRWIEADLDAYELPAASFDLITCINFLDRRLFIEIPRALRHGGAVVYEALLNDPSHPGSAGSSQRFRVNPNELLDAFRSRGFRILSYHEGVRWEKPVASLVGVLP